MSWLMIVLVVAAVFLILMPMLTYLSARRQVGRPVASTTVLVKDDRVLDVALGAKGQAQLQALLRRVA
jgi:biopolymer transport protein ExbD